MRLRLSGGCELAFLRDACAHHDAHASEAAGVAQPAFQCAKATLVLAEDHANHSDLTVKEAQWEKALPDRGRAFSLGVDFLNGWLVPFQGSGSPPVTPMTSPVM
jgi:hypothetical protein